MQGTREFLCNGCCRPRVCISEYELWRYSYSLQPTLVLPFVICSALFGCKRNRNEDGVTMPVPYHTNVSDPCAGKASSAAKQAERRKQYYLFGAEKRPQGSLNLLVLYVLSCMTTWYRSMACSLCRGDIQKRWVSFFVMLSTLNLTNHLESSDWSCCSFCRS